MEEYIPKDKLIKGKRYKCDARNFGIGTWNGKEFDYMRYKFGDRFPREIEFVADVAGVPEFIKVYGSRDDLKNAEFGRINSNQ